MEKYDIYDIEFIYEEDKLKENPRTKKRPVLVLGNDILVPAAKITGTNSKTSKTYEIMECEKAGLTKPSYIIFDRIELQGRQTLTPENYRGRLSDKDIQKIKSLRLEESLNKSFIELLNIDKGLKESLDYRKKTTVGDMLSDSFGNLSAEEIDDLIRLTRRIALKLGMKKNDSDNMIVYAGVEDYDILELLDRANKIDTIKGKFTAVSIYEFNGVKFAVEFINTTNFLYFKDENDANLIRGIAIR